MGKQEIRNFLNKNYKSWKNAFVIYELTDNKINIIDYGMHKASMSMIAKKLIKTYNFEMVVFTIGSPTGNVWFFTKHSLGLV